MGFLVADELIVALVECLDGIQSTAADLAGDTVGIVDVKDGILAAAESNGTGLALGLIDLDGFKPWTKPPMTEAKENLIKLSAGSDEIFLQEWRDGAIEGLPFAPAGTSLVYAEYLAWCKRNGEPYPRPAKHFWATAGKPGWSIARPDRYVDLHSSTTISWRCVIPPEALLKRYADKAVLPREGVSRTRWLTECYFHVEDACQKAGIK